MKHKTTFSCMLISICYSLFLYAQTDEYDPFEGNYTLLKTCEISLFMDDSASNNTFIFDNNDLDSIYNKQTNPINISSSSILKDVVTGDFDGDQLDEMISCYYNESPTDTTIVLYYFNYDETTNQVIEKQLLKLVHQFEYGQIKVEAGNFDDDPQKELVLAFVNDGKIEFKLFNNIDKKLHVIKNIKCDTLNNGLGSSARFDIKCYDYNNDSIDEIACIKSSSLSRAVSGSRYRFKCLFNFSLISVNNPDPELVSSNYEYVNYFSDDLDHTTSVYLDGLNLTMGNFDGEGENELAFGFTYKADLQRDPGIFWYEYRVQYFWTAIKALRVDSILSISDGPFKNLNYWTYSKRTVDGNNNNYGKNPLGTCSLISHDLNDKDGDELTLLNTRYIIVAEADSNLNINKKIEFRHNSMWGTNSHQSLGVASLYFDTISTVIKPHIITYGYSHDPYSLISSHSIPYPQFTSYLNIFEPVLDVNNKITSLKLVQNNELTTNESLSYIENNLLALPDFDGGYQLGTPTKIIKNLIQPTIIINAPPTHFDKIDGVMYDVNYLTSNEVSPEFYTHYVTTASSDNTVSTNLNRSWGVAASYTGGTNIGIYKVKATVQASYGQEFSQSNSTTEFIQVTQESKATTDDKIFGLKTEYHIYEYPVSVEGRSQGNMLSSIPAYDAPVWKESKNSELIDYVYTHEPCNIMSYPYYSNERENPNILNQFSSFINNTGFSISNSTNESWTLEYSTLTGQSIEKSASFGLSLGVEAGGIGWSASVQGDYNKSNMSSHSTTIGEGFMITANFDKLDDSFGETGYTLTPYLYWSKSGALVLDYKIDINPYNSWWSEKYGNKPDLAFILPWRLDPEKNHALSNESKRMLTRDIRIFPSQPQPKDTATIMVTLRNFSLMDHNSETKIQLYHGNPLNGGTLIEDINGNVEQFVSFIESRKMKTLSVKWICPENLYDTPWIFALIDPQNDIDEIHEDNNIGFTSFTLTQELPEYITSGIEETPDNNEFRFDIYPNPASSKVAFSFNLDDDELVIIELYNTLGQKIETILNEWMTQGSHIAYKNIIELPDQVYICHIKAGHKEISKQLIVVK